MKHKGVNQVGAKMYLRLGLAFRPYLALRG